MFAWTDEKLEQILSVVLRGGVMLSAAIVLLGGACFLAKHGAEAPQLQIFRGTAEVYRTVSGVVHGVSTSDCGAIIQLGLLFLIATPIARVIMSWFAFALERDRMYVVITSVVLAVLVYSIAGSH